MAVVCSLIAVSTGIEMKHRELCMTGELSLSGKVLEVGGIQPKIEHAVETQFEKVVLPRANYDEARRLVEANNWQEDLELTPVEDIKELVTRVFLPDESESGEWMDLSCATIIHS